MKSVCKKKLIVVVDLIRQLVSNFLDESTTSYSTNGLQISIDSIPTLTPCQEIDGFEDEDAVKSSDDPQVQAKILFVK